MANDTIVNPSDDVLEGFIADTRARASQRAATSSPVAPDRLQSMMSIFQQAFPDQDFSIQDGAVVGVQKARVPQAAAPAGFSTKAASVGIEEMTAALTAATDDEERYKIATRLNALVQTQKMYKFEQYRTQSEALYGIPDLLQTVDSIKAAEATSPFNPGGGAMSQQRFQVLQALGHARTQAATRIKDLMTNDPVYAAAENLSQGVIAEVLGGLKVGEKSDRLDAKRAAAVVRQDAIDSTPTEQTDAVSILRTGVVPASPEQRRALTEKLVDGKIKLTPVENFLVGADADKLKSFYLTKQDGKDQLLALNLLKQKELKTVGVDNEKEAEVNMRGFVNAMKKDLGDKKDGTIPPAIRDRWNATAVAASKITSSDKDGQQLVHDERVKIRMDYFAGIAKTVQYADVRPWKGIIQGDDVSKEILKTHEPGKPLPVNLFIDKYLQAEPNTDIAVKSKSIQAVLISAFDSIPDSVLVPKMSSDSARIKALELVATRMLATKGWGFTKPHPTIPGLYIQ